MRKNVPMVGFILGLILPVIGFFIVYLGWHSSGESVGQFARSLTHRSGMTSKVLTLSLLANLIPFMYFNTKRLDYAMKGVVIATCLYALLIVFVMFVW